LIDLGKIKAHRLYDLLGLMERARFLVATDSAVLHLARAVPALPVVALQADTPGLWNGSPWRPEWIWSCRYRDFPRRAKSMIEAMDNVQEGRWAYNPTAKREKPTAIHVFSAYNGVNKEAKANWAQAYGKGDEWMHSPVFFGAFGRDSRLGGVQDAVRMPFVKNVIRTGIMRAKNTDAIILTRADTCFNFTALPKPPFYSHRCTMTDPALLKFGYANNLTHHPFIDLFAFTKEWWLQHVAEYPDLIMDDDNVWSRVLAELIKRRGGKEEPFLCYQAQT
jgi:hypothetical protein